MRALIAAMVAFYGYQPATTWWLTTDLYRALVDLQVSQPNVVPPGGPAYIWLALFAVGCWGVADALLQALDTVGQGRVYADPLFTKSQRVERAPESLGLARMAAKAPADIVSGAVRKPEQPEAPSTPLLLRMPSQDPPGK